MGVVSRPEFAQDHESGTESGLTSDSNLTGDKYYYILSINMWFFEVVILEITVRFFKFVWEILLLRPILECPDTSDHRQFLIKKTFS
jgi:hypothetical protein